MSTVIRDGLTSLFDEVVNREGKYLRLEFTKLYDKFYKKYESVFSEIRTEMSSASKREEKAEEIASYIPNYIEERFQGMLKRKKDVLLVDYNMKLVMFVLPMLNQMDPENGQVISEKLVSIWNKTFGTSIGNTEYNQINVGFKKRLCYITTAVCENQNKPDDCYELQTLRTYRDQYLIEECHEEELVEEYYRLAPAIVEAINQKPNKSEIYQNILVTYIQPCIQFIEADEKESCKELYIKMVRTLEKEFLNA